MAYWHIPKTRIFLWWSNGYHRGIAGQISIDISDFTQISIIKKAFGQKSNILKGHPDSWYLFGESTQDLTQAFMPTPMCQVIQRFLERASGSISTLPRHCLRACGCETVRLLAGRGIWAASENQSASYTNTTYSGTRVWKHNLPLRLAIDRHMDARPRNSVSVLRLCYPISGLRRCSA